MQSINMKTKTLFTLGTLFCFSTFSTASALSLPPNNCQEHQEVFAFESLPTPTKHQGGAVLNIKVFYRYTPEAINTNNYPDVRLVDKQMNLFLANLPNGTDYWEILNKNLVHYLLDKFPELASLRIEIKVSPTPDEAFSRSSIVETTRPQACPLNL